MAFWDAFLYTFTARSKSQSVLPDFALSANHSTTRMVSFASMIELAYLRVADFPSKKQGDRHYATLVLTRLIRHRGDDGGKTCMDGGYLSKSARQKSSCECLLMPWAVFLPILRTRKSGRKEKM